MRVVPAQVRDERQGEVVEHKADAALGLDIVDGLDQAELPIPILRADQTLLIQLYALAQKILLLDKDGLCAQGLGCVLQGRVGVPGSHAHAAHVHHIDVVDAVRADLLLRGDPRDGQKGDAQLDGRKPHNGRVDGIVVTDNAV